MKILIACAETDEKNTIFAPLNTPNEESRKTELDNPAGMGSQSQRISLGTITQSEAVRRTIEASYQGTGSRDDGKTARERKIQSNMKKYKIIYCDPPWFRGQRMMSSNKNDRHVEASRHYPVMKKDELCKLPIKQLADDDCAMFMWVTDSNLDEAMEVMKAWGFKYKTVAFVWQKKKKAGSKFVLWDDGL